MSQGMGYPIGGSRKDSDSLNEFELHPIPIDNARMENLESVVYEL